MLVSGVQVHPVNRRPAPRRPLPRPDDRGADGRRPARRQRRVAGRDAERRDAAPSRSSRSGSGRCPTTCPQSIEYSIESLVDFDTTIHVRDLTIPDDVTLLTDGDEIIAKVQAPRVEVERSRSSSRARATRARLPPRARAAKPPRAMAPETPPTRAESERSRGSANSAPRARRPSSTHGQLEPGRPLAKTIGKRIVSSSGEQSREPLAETRPAAARGTRAPAPRTATPRRTRPGTRRSPRP